MKLSNKQRVALIDTLREMASDGVIDMGLYELATDVASKIGAEQLSAGVLKRQLEALDIKWKSGRSSPMAKLFHRVDALERRLRLVELDREAIGNQ